MPHKPMTTLNAEQVSEFRRKAVLYMPKEHWARQAIETLCDALSALQPEEPTEEMMEAGLNAYWRFNGFGRDTVWAIYKAMRAARPRCASQPEQPVAAAAHAVMVPGEALARKFHETYERLAPSFGYETRTETRDFDPTTPNGRLMIAVCTELAAPVSPPADHKAWRDAIEAEPEFPGDMPDEMWEAIRNDRDACTEALRQAVRLTKKGIADRIRSLPPPPGQEGKS